LRRREKKKEGAGFTACVPNTIPEEGERIASPHDELEKTLKPPESLKGGKWGEKAYTTAPKTPVIPSDERHRNEERKRERPRR